jgi:hypothetical protein
MRDTGLGARKEYQEEARQVYQTPLHFIHPFQGALSIHELISTPFVMTLASH